VMLARTVPAKWSLLGVNKKPELIEKRRKELEVRCLPAWRCPSRYNVTLVFWLGQLIRCGGALGGL
jgi:hypothetical protein